MKILPFTTWQSLHSSLHEASDRPVITHLTHVEDLVITDYVKGAQQAAQILANTSKFVRDADHSRVLSECQLNETKLKELVSTCGIGYHHAGLNTEDRRAIESLFLNGDLAVLCEKKTIHV